jgi:hypothetical protein
MWCCLMMGVRMVFQASPSCLPLNLGGNDGSKRCLVARVALAARCVADGAWVGLRSLPGPPRSASFDCRIAIVRARSKFALLGRERGKSRLFLPRSANSGFALLGRFLEKRLRVLAKTRQISSVLPTRFCPIWKSICASWHFPGVYCLNGCASWEILGTFAAFPAAVTPGCKQSGPSSENPPSAFVVWPIARGLANVPDHGWDSPMWQLPSPCRSMNTSTVRRQTRRLNAAMEVHFG